MSLANIEGPQSHNRADPALAEFDLLLDQHSRSELGGLALVKSLDNQGSPFDGQPVEIASEVPATSAFIKRAEQADRSHEVFRLSRNPKTYEVTVESDLTLDDWEKITDPEDWALMQDWVGDLKEELSKNPEDQRSVVFINPTMEGGGVAMMRPPVIHMLRLQNVDAHWFVMEGPKKNDPNVFEFTKQMHNTIQGRLPENVRITEEGKALHQKWAVNDNGEVLKQQDVIKNAALIVLDDPQPAPLARLLKEANPSVKFAWRNHIHNYGDLMMDPATPQGEVHSYLQDELKLRELVDVAIYHPDIKDGFIPRDNYDKAVLAPAVIESHDDMNRELSEEEKLVGIKDINDQIIANNETAIKEGRFDDIQELIDINRDRIILIARFDESKGMDKAMEMGVRIRQRVIERRQAAGIDDAKPVQIVLIGNGSKDDPSGDAMLKQMLDLRREQYPDEKQDIIVQRLLHNYVAINAAMYNDGEAALIAMQMSDAEGCETRITDWINHGIPVLAANIGGMPLQIKEGKSGIVLDYEQPDHDLETGVEFATSLILDQEVYHAMRASTFAASRNYNKREYATTANVTRLARAFHLALTGQKPNKNWKMSDLRQERAARAA